MGDLAVSRSLGDVSCSPYVTPKPYISETFIGDDADFLIVACDGLFDVVEDQEACDIVNSYPIASSAMTLRDYAYLLNSGDNISVIVIHFRNSEIDTLIDKSNIPVIQKRRSMGENITNTLDPNPLDRLQKANSLTWDSGVSISIAVNTSTEININDNYESINENIDITVNNGNTDIETSIGYSDIETNVGLSDVEINHFNGKSDIETSLGYSDIEANNNGNFEYGVVVSEYEESNVTLVPALENLHSIGEMLNQSIDDDEIQMLMEELLGTEEYYVRNNLSP